MGSKKAEKYLLVACTELLTWYMLGGRDTDTFKRFVPADLTGVVVHDRYQNYDAAALGMRDHQLYAAHLIRGLEVCAETYPHPRWPRQLQMALRGLIHAAHLARQQGKDAIVAGTLTMFTGTFRGGVAVGLSEVKRVPGPPKTVTQAVGRVLLEVLRDRTDDVLRFAQDLRIPPTNNQAERYLRPAKTSRRSPAGSARVAHPASVRRPRLPVHRDQARPRCHDRPARRAPRQALDATRPGYGLTL
ncbi:IS66 family transposase [Microbispora rosea]|uniref:IS66 family transposase n=1 Tax=Microbispora rosea TaxID=58117 RepID=UPI003D8CC57B